MGRNAEERRSESGQERIRVLLLTAPHGLYTRRESCEVWYRALWAPGVWEFALHRFSSEACCWASVPYAEGYLGWTLCSEKGPGLRPKNGNARGSLWGHTTDKSPFSRRAPLTGPGTLSPAAGTPESWAPPDLRRPEVGFGASRVGGGGSKLNAFGD